MASISCTDQCPLLVDGIIQEGDTCFKAVKRLWWRVDLADTYLVTKVNLHVSGYIGKATSVILSSLTFK